MTMAGTTLAAGMLGLGIHFGVQVLIVGATEVLAGAGITGVGTTGDGNHGVGTLVGATAVLALDLEVTMVSEGSVMEPIILMVAA